MQAATEDKVQKVVDTMKSQHGRKFTTSISYMGRADIKWDLYKH